MITDKETTNSNSNLVRPAALVCRGTSRCFVVNDSGWQKLGYQNARF
jgi:hypothetical protein